ncbi:MAG: hypothetical protein CSA50_01365 [Gammaproteobacteria bacterium]|nr:MAG: hypothetical protein CSA50_01365 [Gammaproteobacteria bacterium]
MKTIHLVLLLSFTLLSGTLHAGPGAGQPFPKLTLKDQFENPHSITKTDKLILISFDREVSDVVNEFLATQPKIFLDRHHARYISDISAMPGIVTKLFAIPKMKDYNYLLMLATEAEFKAQFDHQQGKLTVYHLEDGVIESIEFVEASKVAGLFQ